MQLRAFIIHGYQSFPEEAWLPWLKRELEARGCKVALPAMPRPDRPVMAEWIGFIAALVGEPGPDTLLIGHSMGVQAVLRYLETVGAAGKAVQKTVLVAGSFPVHRSVAEATAACRGNPALVPWFSVGVDPPLVRRAAGQCTVILSKDDPYIDVANAIPVFRGAVDPQIVLLPTGGHFNEDDGTTELPEVITALFPPL